MGYEVHRRPIKANGVLLDGTPITSESTFKSDIVLSSTVAAGVGVTEAVQAISLSGASGTSTQTITNRGITFITSTGTGAGWIVKLAAPGKKGATKRVLLSLSGGTTVPVQIITAASSQTFFGSTKNSVSFTTANSTNPHAVSLVSRSSVQWAIASISSAQSALVVGATA